MGEVLIFASRCLDPICGPMTVEGEAKKLVPCVAGIGLNVGEIARGFVTTCPSCGLCISWDRPDKFDTLARALK